MERLPYESPFPKESGIVQRMRFRVSALPFAVPKVLIACSAGKDSVALAAVAADLARLGLISVHLVHVHHGQHSHADEAAEAVDDIAAILNMPVSQARLQQHQIERHKGVGIEEALRRERYLALATIAEDAEADVIATGHHQQDQAETLLLRLIRGTGTDGLAGMREQSTMRVPWWESETLPRTIEIWRPLLSESVDLLASIAMQSGLPIVEDPSNNSADYRRNTIRHQVLPMLEEIVAGATGAIARTADVIDSDLVALADAEDVVLATSLHGDRLVTSALREVSPALLQRVVRRWLIEMGAGNNLSADRVSAVTELIRKNRGGARVQLPNNAQVVVEDGQVLYRKT